MARIFIEGFEDNSLRRFDTLNSASIAAAKTGMSGSYCLDLLGSGDYARKSVTARVDYYVSCRLHADSTSGALLRSVLTFYDGATIHSFLGLNATNYLVAYKTNTSTVLGTSAAAISPDTTYVIEVYCLIDDTNGRFVVKVNGLSVIDFTGDTRNAGTAQITSVGFGANGVSGLYAYQYFDDIKIDNAAWPGSNRIEGIAVTGNGNQNDMTASVGANYECVNDVDDADYISTNTNNHLDLFTFGNLTSAIASVACVQVSASARKQGAATPQNLQLAVRQGGTDYVSGNKTLPNAYGLDLFNLWETDPATGVAWTESGVNSAEFGVKAVA